MSLHHMPNSDVLERFIALHSSLSDGTGWQNDQSWMRFAAQTAVLCAGGPVETARQIRQAADTLEAAAE